MNYDISIWSINPLKIEATLQKEDKWQHDKNASFLSKNDWQRVVNNSVEVEEEDIPEEVLPTLPGIRYLTEINLEPISAPAAVRTLLGKISKSIAKDTIGVMVDQQEDTITALSGIKGFVPVTKQSTNERVSL